MTATTPFFPEDNQFKSENSHTENNSPSLNSEQLPLLERTEARQNGKTPREKQWDKEREQQQYLHALENGKNGKTHDSHNEVDYIDVVAVRVDHQIDADHLEELKQSGILPELQALNYRSLDGIETQQHLNFAPNPQHSSYKGSLLWIGADLTDYSKPCLNGRVKCRVPRLNEEGDVVKYEPPKGSPNQIEFGRISSNLFNQFCDKYNAPRLNNENFGQWLIRNKHIPLVLTEGSKKMLCLWSNLIVAISIPGVWNGRLKDDSGTYQINPTLAPFIEGREKVIFAFDNDTLPTTKEAVGDAQVRTGRLFQELGVKVFVANTKQWDPALKGIDDLIVAKGIEAAQWAIANAIDLDDWVYFNTLYKPEVKGMTWNKIVFNPRIPLIICQNVDVARYLGSIGYAALAPYRFAKLLVTVTNNKGETLENLHPSLLGLIQNKKEVILYSQRKNDYVENDCDIDFYQQFTKKIKNPISLLKYFNFSKTREQDKYQSLALRQEFEECFSFRLSYAPRNQTPNKTYYSVIKDILVKEWANKLSYVSTEKCWYKYNQKKKGVWTCLPDDFLPKEIISDKLNHLVDKYGLNPFENKDIESIYLSLQRGLNYGEWDEKTTTLVPFKNCILDLNTKEQLPHSPNNRLKWALPHNYNPSASSDYIVNWIKETVGEKQLPIIRAFLAATIYGIKNLEAYCQFIGRGQVGKTTLQNIFIAMIGRENHCVTSLSDLSNNQFGLAEIIGKRLVTIAECESFGGDGTTLKALTGNSVVTVNRKFKDALTFNFDGVLVMAGNQMPRFTDQSGAIERRCKTVFFENYVPRNKVNTNLISFDINGTPVGDFVEHLPGLTNWALGLSPQEAVKIIHSENSTPKENQVNTILETNRLASWADECLVFDSTKDIKTYVGNYKKEGGIVLNWQTHLYPSYRNYCEENGIRESNALTTRTFSGELEALLNHILKKFSTKKHKDEKGAYFPHLSIRVPESNQPRLISQVWNSLTDNLTDQTHFLTDNLTSQTLEADGFDESDGSFLIKAEKKLIEKEVLPKEENPSPPSEENNIIFPEKRIIEDNPSYPSNPSVPVVSSVSHPSAIHQESVSHPSGTPNSYSEEDFVELSKVLDLVMDVERKDSSSKQLEELLEFYNPTVLKEAARRLNDNAKKQLIEELITELDKKRLK